LRIPGEQEPGIFSAFSTKSREFEFREQGITMLVFAATLAIHERPLTYPYRKSSPGILMMETAKDWKAKNVSLALYPARYRRILAQ
jgi:hypothetical protein